MNYDDLMCPITMDWLEDPITLPCCGRAISREPMVQWKQNSDNCPACNQQLDNFNPMTVAKSINIAYLVEKAKNEGAVPELFKQEKKESKWVAQIHKLCNNDAVYQTVIGKLHISNTDNKYQFKTLILPVVDESGSMSGAPNRQVKYSLHRILDMTYKHSQLMTTVIGYSDNAVNFEIDTKMPQALFRDSVEKVGRGGGTSFKSAFEEILKICKKHVANPDISSIVIIFLTDGEDSAVTKDKRIELVNNLKTEMKKIWTKEFVVHTVGFGGSHDYNFLNNLRQIGTSEGAYRYADPGEDTDSLSNKINSLLDVIAASSSIPLKISKSSVPILSGDNDKYWVELTGHQEAPEFEITINDQEAVKIQAEFGENENDPKVWDEWYTQLVDEIANEILMLSTSKIDSLDKEIHCELLQQRINAILMRIDSTSANAGRLEKLRESLKIMQSGGSVNQSKLNDMKFEGKYATKSSGQPKVQVVSGGSATTLAYIVPVPQKPKKWEIIEKKKGRRCNSTAKAKQPFIVLGRYKKQDAVEWFEKNIMNHKDELDDNGSNVLMMACSIGKQAVIEVLLKSKLFDLNQKNNDGYNVIDLAAIYGYDHIYDLLVSHGAKLSIDGQLLLRTCLTTNGTKYNIYTRLASRLIKDKIATITDEMIENCPSNESVTWLSARSSKAISIETAIMKGMLDIVTDQLNTIDKISWKPFLDIFTKPTNEHIAIVDLLLQNKKADPNEQFEITDEDGEKGISFPLYAACEKGQVSMFKTLMKYVDKATLNRQNHHGTTCLWIASCNRHIDIVMELLYLGADPNVPNFKGDGPLIPSIQRGNDSIAELLLEAGAKMSVYNPERDGPVLNCCRTGQAKILEMLFKRMNKEEIVAILDVYHPIDGFPPLMAATELDKVECIKVCYKFGAKLEWRTMDDNKVIPGATALHLSCHYNRLTATRTLIELGSNVKAQTSVGGYTPLHIAIKQNHPNMVRYLLSLPEGKECIEVTDSDGRTPAYYAKNNPEILDEFFTNKLSLMLGKIIDSDSEMEEKCAKVLSKYGRSAICYEYNDITGTPLDDGSSLIAHALLNGNKKLIEELGHMKADLYKQDDYGVPAIFWAQLLGYNIDGAQANEQSIKMIDNVHTSMKKSMQNKLLLNVQVGQPKLLEAPPGVMDPLEKMNNGYSLNINDTVIKNLKSLKSIDHSLLGFIEKLKNNKVFPDGKTYLERLLFEAKVHVIKIIAGGETTLDAIHLMSIYLHSSNTTIFKQVNQSLVNYKPNDVWQPFIGCLYQGLNLIKPFGGECYRGVDIRFNMKDFAIGNTLKWNAFSIASQEYKSCNELLNKKKGVIFIIQSKTGRPISSYEKVQNDKTVVFLPGTQFSIKGYIKPSLTALAQANIRGSTFKISDKDIERSINGENCIIIELEEI